MSPHIDHLYEFAMNNQGLKKYNILHKTFTIPAGNQ